MKYMNNIIGCLFLVSVFVFNACNESADEIFFTGNEYENILQYIEKGGDEYSMFKKLVETGLVNDALSSYNNHLGGDNYTLFLPTNNAVDLFIQENNDYSSFEDLIKDTSYVKVLVMYHILNSEVLSNDFPNGALSALTLSGDILTVNFSIVDEGDIIYKINNLSRVTQSDIIKSNGVVHKIDKMLMPVAYTAYDWIINNKLEGYKIFAELLEICGLKDTMNYYTVDELGVAYYSGYTLFAESDELYAENNIHSLQDLIDVISPSQTDYTNQSNKLNKFARYHILNTKVFLDQFKQGIFNTYSEYPVSVDVLDEDLLFNKGVNVFDTVIEDADTSYIDYLELNVTTSNIPTKTGPIHQLNRILYQYRPGLKEIDINFYNEPKIDELKTYKGTFLILEEDLKNISLVGRDYLLYTCSSSNINAVENNDYITLSGDFEMTYTTQKVLAGLYKISIVADRDNNNNAMIQIYLDGEKVGGLVDLTKGSDYRSSFSPYFVLDNVQFKENGTHEIKIKTIRPGRLNLDRLILTPVSK